MACRCAFAWIDTNRSARARFAKLVRSRRAILGELRGAPGDVEHELLLQEAGRPHRAGVVAAVARVEHERAERSHLLLLRPGLGRTREIEDEAMRVRERARARRARHALEDDAQEGVPARALDAHLAHEAVADLLDLRRRGEADQPDPRLLRALRLDTVREGAGGLDDDAGERRVGAEPELLEGDLRRGRPGRRRSGGDGHAGGEPREHPAHERLGHQPHPAPHPDGRVEHDRRLVHEDLGPVAGERHDVAWESEPRPHARRARLEPGAVQGFRKPPELDVGPAVVGHPGQRRARRSRRDEQERQEGDGETHLAHGEANSSNARRRPARFKFASPKANPRAAGPQGAPARRRAGRGPPIRPLAPGAPG